MAIIGFGLMGAQISQVFVQSGRFSVLAYDVSEEQLKTGIELIRKGKYGLETAVSKGRISSEEAEMALSRVETTTSIERALTGADLVLEAVIEDLKTKQAVMRLASTLAKSNAILASNTSTLSIAKIGSVLQSEARKRIVGMHFFNPPQIMKLVEIVRTTETSDVTTEAVVGISKTLGKSPVVVYDIPGFIANRIGISVFSEASNLLERRVASVRDIDLAMRLGYGYPMGPFELGDLVGLDSRLRNMEALYGETHDERFKPPSILKKLVADGYLGDPKVKKGSKGGYYEFFGLSRPTEEAC